jgi:hypothetical protein
VVIDARELTVQVSAGRGRARLPILRRAVACTCSKAGLPVDRIDDAVLILEALLGDARTARSEEVHLVLTARPGSFALLMGPLAGDEADRLLEHAELPMVGPIVERLASSATTVDDGSHLLVVVDAR